MKILLLASICLFHCFMYSQQSINGVLINSETKVEVPYANIGIVNRNKGTVSNNEGKFELEIPIKFKLESIKLSSIGY